MYVNGKFDQSTIVWNGDNSGIRADVVTDVGRFPVKVHTKFLSRLGWDGDQWGDKDVLVRLYAKVAMRKR